MGVWHVLYVDTPVSVAVLIVFCCQKDNFIQSGIHHKQSAMCVCVLHTCILRTCTCLLFVYIHVYYMYACMHLYSDIATYKYSL